MSAQAAPAATSGTMQPNNLASDVKTQDQPVQKYKPCCVCTDEKSKRDECMLFSTGPDPQESCKDIIGKYRSCMASYGFNIA